MHILQEIGSYAGFAAVVGLAILSALYFSQARDVKRLRDWAGRAPERAAEIDSGGRAVAAVPVAARPQPQVRPAQPAPGVAPAAAAAAAGAAPAAATGPAAAAAGNGSEEPEDEEDFAGDEVAAQGAPQAAGANGDDEDDEDDLDDAEEQTSVAPAAATAAGAVASGAGTAERGAATGQGAAAPASASPATGDTGTGAKVLPARRPVPPVRPRPTIPPRTPPPRPGQTSVLTQPPGSRPPARAGRRGLAPRYIALIVAGIVILGLGGTVGVLQLTKTKSKTNQGKVVPDTNVGDPTRSPDKPESARVNPANVTVTVLNATSTTGLAQRILSRLEVAGFQRGNSGNAVQRQRAESVVMYKPGQQPAARAVARKLGIGSTEAIDAQGQQLAGSAGVVVVLGADKANQ